MAKAGYWAQDRVATIDDTSQPEATCAHSEAGFRECAVVGNTDSPSRERARKEIKVPYISAAAAMAGR